MELAKKAVQSGRLTAQAFDKLRTRFNAIHAWAMEHLGEEALRSAVQSLDPKTYSPPRIDRLDKRPAARSPAREQTPPAVPPYLFPKDGDWRFTQRVRASAVPKVDAIRDQALSLGWREARLYQNRGRFRFPCGEDCGLVCFLDENKRIGNVTRQSIEIVGPSPKEYRTRFSNPDVGEEDLLRLAGSGRVKFHESGEYVYWQGRKPGRFIFVIQQGTLKLVDESQQAEVLQDVLGEGDIIGRKGLRARTNTSIRRKTTSDVIIYALLAKEFEELAERHPKFARYVESNFSVAPVDVTDKATDGEAGGPGGARLPIDFLAGRMMTCDGGTPLQKAVGQMSKASRDTLVVTRKGAPAGYLNDSSFRRLASDDIERAGGVADVMTTELPVLTDALPPHAYALEMLRGGGSAVGIMDSQGALKAVVTESDLTLLGIPNLPQLGHEIRRSQTTAELGELRRLALRFAAQSLTDPSHVVWVSEALSELNRLIVSRAIELTEDAADGRQGENRCWVFFWSRSPRRAAHRSYPGCRRYP